jgi:O-antigen/teichoic acid export membrane protein
MIMLSKLATEDIMGLYAAAFKLFEIQHFVPFIVSAAIYPVLSRLWSNEQPLHKRATQKGIEYMVLIAVPLSILMMVFAKDCLVLIYGDDGGFEAATLSLRVFNLELVFMYVASLLGTALVASDKQRSSMLVTFAAIPLSFVLNYFLIPLTQSQLGNGGVGSAAATGITEMCIMLVYIILMPKGGLSDFRYSIIPKSLAGGLSLLGFIWLMSFVGFPWYLQSVMGAGLYLTVLFTLRTFEPMEMHFLRSLFAVRNVDTLKAVLRLDQS